MYKFRGYYIPDQMMGSIKRYIEYGVIPGNFLQAIICNNLKEAVGKADDENIDNLPAYIGYFYNEAPTNCWGSHKRMVDWADQLGRNGVDMELLDKNLKSTTIKEEYEIARSKHADRLIEFMEKSNE